MVGFFAWLRLARQFGGWQKQFPSWPASQKGPKDDERKPMLILGNRAPRIAATHSDSDFEATNYDR